MYFVYHSNTIVVRLTKGQWIKISWSTILLIFFPGGITLIKTFVMIFILSFTLNIPKAVKKSGGFKNNFFSF